MPKTLDLHTHSIHSDGTSAPAEVVRRAGERGVSLLALTDHDSVSGFEEALQAGRERGVEVVCGVEINTREHDNLHILGYGFDPASGALSGALEDFRERRRRRALDILRRLNDAGVRISMEDVEEAAGPGRDFSRDALGRPHIADALARLGHARNRKDAFDRWLLRGRPGFVDPQGPTAAEAIAVIRAAGGWASLAHPGSCNGEARLGALTAAGLAGVEAHYPTHSGEVTRRLLKAAAERGLAVTGGSDYHGPGTGREEIGGVELGPEAASRLRELLAGSAP